MNKKLFLLFFFLILLVNLGNGYVGKGELQIEPGRMELTYIIGKIGNSADIVSTNSTNGTTIYLIVGGTTSGIRNSSKGYVSMGILKMINLIDEIKEGQVGGSGGTNCGEGWHLENNMCVKNPTILEEFVEKVPEPIKKSAIPIGVGILTIGGLYCYNNQDKMLLFYKKKKKETEKKINKYSHLKPEYVRGEVVKDLKEEKSKLEKKIKKESKKINNLLDED